MKSSLSKKSQLIIASHNRGKLVEFNELLADWPVELIAQSERGVREVEETGLTYVENALIKARHAARLTGLPVLADDSGLSVAALAGAPGVKSARYAGENATDADRIEKLLKSLNASGESCRKAAFHCVLVLLAFAEDPAPIVCHGIWQGEILSQPQGSHGFGYDPIFYCPEHQCSAAELTSAVKNCISHRARAFSLLARHLRGFLLTS